MHLYCPQIKVDGKHFFIPDHDAKRYAFIVGKKLKHFHIRTKENGFLFIALKVDITPIGNSVYIWTNLQWIIRNFSIILQWIFWFCFLESAVVDWYYNHVYDGHFRLAKSGGRKTECFAMFYQLEEFSARPRNNRDAERLHCKNVNDKTSCLSNIEYCIFGGQLRFHFVPHSPLERHCHNSDSEWTCEDDSGPETKAKPKAKRAPPAKVTGTFTIQHSLLRLVKIIFRFRCRFQSKCYVSNVIATEIESSATRNTVQVL